MNLIARLHCNIEIPAFLGMTFRRVIKVLVYIAAVSYFISKIIDAKDKLEDGRIGTMFLKISGATVQGEACVIDLHCTVLGLAISNFTCSGNCIS